MTITTLWLTDVETSARMDRGILTDLFTEGVKDVQGGQFKVIPRASGANMTVTVQKGTTDAAVAFIAGDDVADQGIYRVAMDASITDIAVAAAPASGTRTDLVVFETIDKTAVGGTTNTSRPRIITGQSALGASDKTMIVLARISVSAGQTSIQAQHITDLRVQSGKAALSFRATDVQWFTTSGTWTKVTDAKAVEFIGLGAGASGQGGQASDVNGTPNGGVGGNGGERVRVLIPAAGLAATMPVVVGAGGVPAAGGTPPGGSGIGGGAGSNPGGDTSFAGVVARGGNSSRTPFTGGIGGGQVGYSDTNPQPGGRSNGGGGGGGGGKSRFQSGAQGPAGAAGTNNEVSLAPPSNTATGGAGGAGGGIGSAGSPGSFPGGGGGGGGANSTTGSGSGGAGGAGGDGLAVLITYT